MAHYVRRTVCMAWHSRLFLQKAFKLIYFCSSPNQRIMQCSYLFADCSGQSYLQPLRSENKTLMILQTNHKNLLINALNYCQPLPRSPACWSSCWPKDAMGTVTQHSPQVVGALCSCWLPCESMWLLMYTVQSHPCMENWSNSLHGSTDFIKYLRIFDTYDAPEPSSILSLAEDLLNPWITGNCILCPTLKLSCPISCTYLHTCL